MAQWYQTSRRTLVEGEPNKTGQEDSCPVIRRGHGSRPSISRTARRYTFRIAAELRLRLRSLWSPSSGRAGGPEGDDSESTSLVAPPFPSSRNLDPQCTGRSADPVERRQDRRAYCAERPTQSQWEESGRSLPAALAAAPIPSQPRLLLRPGSRCVID